MHCQRPPPPPLQSSPPWGGERSLGPESIGNTRRQRKFLQGAEADLHCDDSWCNPPPPWGGKRPDKRGEIARGRGGITHWLLKDAPLASFKLQET